MFVTIEQYAEMHDLSYDFVRWVTDKRLFIAEYKLCDTWYVDSEKPFNYTKYIRSNNKKYMTDFEIEAYRRLCNVLRQMKKRCSNPNDSHYYLYGGRGIKICDEWMSNTLSFIVWALNNGYNFGLQIDRIDNDGNYEPKNCQWITRSENSKKARKPYSLKYSRIKGQKKMYQELIEYCPEWKKDLKEPKYPWEE